jgi:hypothetical protein
MANFKPENMTEDMLAKATPIWKGYKNLHPVIEKENKGILALLDWIADIVECKIKIETLRSIEQKFPEVPIIHFIL